MRSDVIKILWSVDTLKTSGIKKYTGTNNDILSPFNLLKSDGMSSDFQLNS